MASPPSMAKLMAPSLGRALGRPRVSSRIDEALGDASCWVAAPAGYGKTTAAADYLRGRSVPYVWYRIDEGDQDIASFFHHLALSHRTDGAGAPPTFGPEYADQPRAFARRFFRAYFAQMPAGGVLVLDDLQDADAPAFRDLLAVLLHELPEGVRCLFLSRTLPPRELDPFLMAGRLAVIGQDVLQFPEDEARALIDSRRPARNAHVPIERARGWAAGLVLLAESAMAANLSTFDAMDDASSVSENALFDVLGRQVFENLPSGEQDVLLKLSVLPEITPALATAMVGSQDAGALLERLHRRQLLITRVDRSDRLVFRLHDLLRDFLHRRLEQRLSSDDEALVKARAATALEQSGRFDDAIDLALQSRSWGLARRLIVARAEAVLDQGRRATFIEWCSGLPDGELDGWLCYWRGVAHLPDDALAETWLERAWTLFERSGDPRGRRLAVARAVLVKTDSWRTHTGLSTWTRRAQALLDEPSTEAAADDDLLTLMGFLRALDFADDYRAATPAAAVLASRLIERLADRRPADDANLRLLASAMAIEHAGSKGQADLFEQATDAVVQDLDDETVSPWVLGLWLVAFGSVSGRYFPYARRHFPYADAEEALRAAIALGEREGFRSVEFGALYHLQYQMKLRNNLSELSVLIERLAEIADSRHTTQAAVVADCQAALHTMRGAVADAHAACARIMVAVEAADEPPIERWPHFITQFQAHLAGRDPVEAARRLTELLPLFDGAVRERTQVCVRIAEALDARWNRPRAYPQRLRIAVEALREANWSAALANLPDLLADLLADALDLGVETDFCRRLIRQRRLSPPERRPPDWPWALKVHVLGGFRLELDGAPLDLGPKPAARSLDLLRALAVAKGHTCALADLHDWLWSDADGDMAKAACEQALNRLRKLLGRSDLIVQREGKLRLAMNAVWVDLDHWEARLHDLIDARGQDATSAEALRDLLATFPGAPLAHEREGPWTAAAAERVRGKVVEAALRLAGRYEDVGDAAKARAVHLRALDVYPDAASIHEALIAGRLARDDVAGAREDYARFTKTWPDDPDAPPSATFQALFTRATKVAGGEGGSP